MDQSKPKAEGDVAGNQAGAPGVLVRMTTALFLITVLAFGQHAHTPGMESRGNVAMGFDHARATHHFIITPDGGEIRITANRVDDAKTVGEIRAHVRDIEKLFASGDFAKPEHIHGTMPPGATTMAELKGEIVYRYRRRSQAPRW